jgi:hypothetical protein
MNIYQINLRNIDRREETQSNLNRLFSVLLWQTIEALINWIRGNTVVVVIIVVVVQG